MPEDDWYWVDLSTEGHMKTVLSFTPSFTLRSCGTVMYCPRTRITGQPLKIVTAAPLLTPSSHAPAGMEVPFWAWA